MCCLDDVIRQLSRLASGLRGWLSLFRPIGCLHSIYCLNVLYGVEMAGTKVGVIFRDTVRLQASVECGETGESNGSNWSTCGTVHVEFTRGWNTMVSCRTASLAALFLSVLKGSILTLPLWCHGMCLDCVK
jgi:hypothetical protein